jgi:hypothetical protein
MPRSLSPSPSTRRHGSGWGLAGKRKGQYRKATLIERYGPDKNMVTGG